MAEIPARELCIEWRQHPVTRYLLADLAEQVAELQDAWGRGAFTTETADGTLQLNASSIGAVKALQEVILDIREIAGEDEDED